MFLCLLLYFFLVVPAAVVVVVALWTALDSFFAGNLLPVAFAVVNAFGGWDDDFEDFDDEEEDEDDDDFGDDEAAAKDVLIRRVCDRWLPLTGEKAAPSTLAVPAHAKRNNATAQIRPMEGRGLIVCSVIGRVRDLNNTNGEMKVKALYPLGLFLLSISTVRSRSLYRCKGWIGGWAHEWMDTPTNRQTRRSQRTKEQKNGPIEKKKTRLPPVGLGT